MQEVKPKLWELREPRNLAGLIDIYESNYFRVMRLVPELDEFEGTVVSRVAGALDLYLTVQERQPYTTTILLTYHFEDDGEVLFEPAAKISICHDVRTAEVVSHFRRRRQRWVRQWRRRSMPEVDRKWELNRFLQKWLGFCHRQGHLFLRATTTQVPPTE
ncbi:MAG: hypothetical protein ACI8PT_003321 [Gammaproteobacteria bacterium]|jgi:uncharacterized protein YqiB (DUF1249 family)